LIQEHQVAGVVREFEGAWFLYYETAAYMLGYHAEFEPDYDSGLGCVLITLTPLS